MTNLEKMVVAIQTLKTDCQFGFKGDDFSTEEHFNSIKWVTGEDENGTAITVDVCPHSEITWTKVKAEIDKLGA